MSGRSEPLTGYRHICPICGREFWGKLRMEIQEEQART